MFPPHIPIATHRQAGTRGGQLAYQANVEGLAVSCPANLLGGPSDLLLGGPERRRSRVVDELGLVLVQDRAQLLSFG